MDFQKKKKQQDNDWNLDDTIVGEKLKKEGISGSGWEEVIKW